MNKYDNFEQKFLDKLPEVTEKMVNKLDIKNMMKQETPVVPVDYSINDETPIIEGGTTKANVRVRTDGVSKQAPVDEYYNAFSGINNNVASSFMLIVVGVFILVALVATITFAVLNYLS